MSRQPPEILVRAKSRLNNWSDIQYVIATAKLGSFHSAATALETNQSTVGRRVARFEAYLGTKIFERHATGMRLTAAGKILYDKAVRMEETANDIESSLLAFDSRLSGTVRIFATEAPRLPLVGSGPRGFFSHPPRRGYRSRHRSAGTRPVLSRSRPCSVHRAAEESTFGRFQNREGRPLAVHLEVL